ncbi:hypothetical protein BCR34DRAFT_76202 [Clohesyomyces aquaticus]|uniref:Uncharacterized protein n=1 Tax=Clohesyomyces aquaticus TaxID=1231657 RepID=A0A1Y1YYW1_9PLEO|nr:hypothetical protein BCR34DRAFT_76202 [Clohesyomyces aquaticus]
MAPPASPCNLLTTIRCKIGNSILEQTESICISDRLRRDTSQRCRDRSQRPLSTRLGSIPRYGGVGRNTNGQIFVSASTTSTYCSREAFHNVGIVPPPVQQHWTSNLESESVGQRGCFRSDRDETVLSSRLSPPITTEYGSLVVVANQMRFTIC